MRLLDARALIHEGVARLVDDVEVGHPLYAILSHTWGREEVLFEDIKLGPDFEADGGPSELDRRSQGYGHQTRSEPRDFWGKPGWQEFESPELVPRRKRGVCSECRRRPTSDRASAKPRVKEGWYKVYNACLRACYDDLDYIWIDSCCINKDSSAELTEAINAMYRWYADSHVCYVHLEDCRWCPKGPTTRIGYGSVNACSKTQIERCRWLTRG